LRALQLRLQILLTAILQKAEGVDYFRGKRLAEKFAAWAKEKGISPLPYYYIGNRSRFRRTK
jgi:hypothetical protein